MENKQKPSLRLEVLTRSLQQENTVVCKPEMFDWPLYTDKSFTTQESPDAKQICRDVLYVLSQVRPFEVILSLLADVENKRLAFQRTTSAIFYLEGKTMLTLSHWRDSGNHSSQKMYNRMSSWLEIEEDLSKSSSEERYRIESIVAKMSHKEWFDFFQKRIFERAEFLSKKYEKKRNEADELFKSSCMMASAACVFVFRS